MPAVRERPRKGGQAKSRNESPAVSAAPLVAAPWVPLALTGGLLLLSLLPRVQQNVVLVRSFWGAAAALVLWQAGLYLRRQRTNAAAPPTLLLVPPRAQHYVQSLCQLSV